MKSESEWIPEEEDWDDEEWAFSVPWHVRFLIWIQFWKR